MYLEFMHLVTEHSECYGRHIHPASSLPNPELVRFTHAIIHMYSSSVLLAVWYSTV